MPTAGIDFLLIIAFMTSATMLLCVHLLPHLSKKMKSWGERAYVRLIGITSGTFLLFALSTVLQSEDDLRMYAIIFILGLAGVIAIWYIDMEIGLEFINKRGLLRLAVGGVFALVFFSTIGIAFRESALLAIRGIFLGTAVGFILATTAYRQMLPRWTAWGFARPKTKQEKQIADFSKNNISAATETAHSYGFIGSYAFVITILGIASLMFGYAAREQIELFVMASVPSLLVSFLGGYFALTLYADKKVRRHSR